MTLRVGMIGAGWVTRWHLDAWRALGHRATVVAIADPATDRCRERAAAYGIAAQYADAAEMIAAEKLDAVDIASPREWHAAHVRIAAAAGLPIHCQKPLAPTHAEAAALVAEVGSRVPFVVHENWRFRPHYRTVRRWLDARRIGDVVQADMAVFSSGFVPDALGALPALVRQPMLTGLAQMLVGEIMIHHIDTLRYLLGELALSAAAMGQICPALTGEDHATLAMTTRHGVPVILRGNLHAHGYPPTVFDRLEVFGRTGRILLEGSRLSLTGVSGETVQIDHTADYAAGYFAATAAFLDSVDTGAVAENAALSNLGTLLLRDQAYQMAQQLKAASAPSA